MIRLVGSGYYGKQNYLIGTCDECKETAMGIMANRTKIQCTCEKTVFDKLPLYYIKSNGFPMIIYKLTHKPTGKNFIGVVVTKETEPKKAKKVIDKEVEYLRDFRTFHISKDLKKKLKTDEFEWSIISTPKSMVRALVDERLYINLYNAMEPEGFNQVAYLETLKNKTRQRHG